MHPLQIPNLDAAFAALADSTRRAILARLMDGEATVQDLARPFAISQPAISRHLKVLEDAGLIDTRIKGTARPRSLNPETVQLMWDWLSQYRALWEARYNRLDDVLLRIADEENSPNDATPTPLAPKE
jgi:DNA-binding transcriptional ArsR family regulator